MLQLLGGAYAGDLSGYADEPAHYVTGLMVHDYLAAFPWEAPMPFARRFYDHYPMVAIGHWPPIFYMTQALWGLVAGTSKTSILLLIAAIAGATATALYRYWRPRFGVATSILLALAFLATPVVQSYSRMVMAEMLVTLFILLAVFAYARFLDAERVRDAVLFGLLSAAAILTKPNGLALALVPLLAIGATRRFDLVRRASFWLPALIVIVVCGPWYVLTADLAREGWSASYDPAWLIRHPARENTLLLIDVVGVPVFVLALAGILCALWPRHANGAGSDTGVMFALLVSVAVFHSFVVPVREVRHMIPAVPPLLAFAAVAVATLAGQIRISDRARQRVVAAFAAATAAALLFAGTRTPQKPRTAVDVIVQHILSQGDTSGPVLVSSEASGEGIFIAELAARERRPGHRVLRGSKVLSTSDWDGSQYRLLHQTTESVGEYLLTEGVTQIVVDSASSNTGVPRPHHRQLIDLLTTSNRWRRIDAIRQDARFQVFESALSR